MISHDKMQNDEYSTMTNAIADENHIIISSSHNNNDTNSIRTANRTHINNEQMSHHSIQRTVCMLLAVLLYTCAVAVGDLSEPPDCTNIMCDSICPSDSKLVRRIDNNPNIDTIISQSETNVTRPTNETEEMIIEAGSVMTREKRAIPLRFKRRRENIKITPGGYIRRRRDLNDSIESSSLASKAAFAECCSADRVQCECDLTKCPNIQCASNEYKTTTVPGTRMPGRCCPQIVCATQEPTCLSHNLKRHYNIGDRWKDDPCTSCECGEMGVLNCQISVCKALHCEKQMPIPGQCCPVCNASGSKFCQSDENCDLHCRNGFERDPLHDCNICRCAKTIPMTTSSTTGRTIESIANATEVETIATRISDWTTDSNDHYSPPSDDEDNKISSSTIPVDPQDWNWIQNLPTSMSIVLILIAFVAVVAVFCCTCRHFNRNKGKHHLNRKQNTPLIRGSISDALS